MEMIKSFTHLSVKLKYNPIGFNEMLLHPEKSPHRNKKNIVNNNKAYLIEYLQMQQNQFQHAVNTDAKNAENRRTHEAPSDLQANSSNGSIAEHLNDSSITNRTKKPIGSIPPLPPASANPSSQTPRNKSKDYKLNFKSSANGWSPLSVKKHVS